jgi:four helix bundle protein
MKAKEYDIHERIFNFVIAVILFLSKVPKTPTNLIFIGQCIRSVTSMGANDQEADGALTTKDFIHGFTIVRKEGKETVYWLRVIARTNKDLISEADVLIKEGNEIVAVVSTIIINTMKNKK